MAHCRTVILSRRFEEQALVYIGYIEIDRIVNGMTETVAVHPDRGMQTSNPSVMAVTCDLRGAVYVVYYVYDDDEAELVGFYRMVAPRV